MGPIKEALREKSPPALFREEETNSDFWQILGHSIKDGGLGISHPRLSAESAYNTSMAASGEVIDSILGDYALNYIGHKACIRRTSTGTRKEREHVELAELDR